MSTRSLQSELGGRGGVTRNSDVIEHPGTDRRHGDPDPQRRRGDPYLIVAGIVLLAVGAYFAAGAIELGIGTARRMGSGYFPLVLGVLVGFFGIGFALRGILVEGRRTAPELRPFVWVGLSIVGFALGIEWFGLIPAIFVSVLLSSVASPRTSGREALAMAALTSAAAWLVFVEGLAMTIPAVRLPF